MKSYFDRIILDRFGATVGTKILKLEFFLIIFLLLKIVVQNIILSKKILDAGKI